MAPRQLDASDSCEASSSLTALRNSDNNRGESLSLFHSEKAFLEIAHQAPDQSVDSHLLDFSEALRTVTKALRRAAESKAAAQAEADEWKRRYELARARNLQWEFKGECSMNSNGELVKTIVANGTTESMKGQATKGDFPKCCENEICSHEVLQDEITNSIPKSPSNVLSKKASFKLSWKSNAEHNDQHKHDIVSFDQGDIRTAQRSSKQIALRWRTDPQTVLIFTKPNSPPVRDACVQMVRWLRDDKKLNIYVEPRVRSELLIESSTFDYVQTWQDDDEIMQLHTKVDLLITLGGDGTVLWAASMFRGPVPPIVAFSLGSLGFMTPFYVEQYRESLTSILKGPLNITLRHRLQCHIERDQAEKGSEAEEPFFVLNEVTVDRGISPFLTNLECYCDKSFLTTVQGDGLILSTTSGSTAYSLAAGGSMVHPQVPGILFTPICPHSLSFRPLIFPEHVNLRVQVPFTSRGHAWVSFDGKNRKQLAAGDALVCRMSPWPVPTACLSDSTADFLHSIQDGLHWNLRKTQNPKDK